MYVMSNEVVTPATSLINAIDSKTEFEFEHTLPAGADQIHTRPGWEGQSLGKIRQMQQERYSELLEIRRGTF
jgi:hypothetical protein